MIFEEAKSTVLDYAHIRVMTALGFQWALKNAQDVAFDGETLKLSVNPTFSHQFLGPDMSRELIRWLGWVALTGWFAYLFVYSFFFHDPEDLIRAPIPPILRTAGHVAAAGAYFNFMRRKRIPAEKLLLGRNGLRFSYRSNESFVEKTLLWTEIREIVLITGQPGEVLQLNVLPSKKRVITIYDAEDISRFQVFLKNHVNCQVVGVVSHLAYSIMPVLAFATAAAICVLGDFYGREITFFIAKKIVAPIIAPFFH
jgi:hypothetical protein